MENNKIKILKDLKNSYFDVNYACANSNISITEFNQFLIDDIEFNNKVELIKGKIRFKILSEIFGSQTIKIINIKLLPRLLDSELFKGTIYEKLAQKKEINNIDSSKKEIIIN